MGKPVLRREWILERLNEQSSISLEEIVTEFSVSEVTVRRDLESLESEGKLVRTIGGAILGSNRSDSVFRKMDHYVNEKNEIAEKALTLIEDGDIIGLTGGSTTYYLAKRIRNANKRLTVATNSLNIAYALAGLDDIQVIVLGGVVRNSSLEMYGPMTDTLLANINIQRLFMGADGVSISGGVMVSDEGISRTNQLMMERSTQKILVSDHSKLSQSSLFVVSPVHVFDRIITDSQIDGSVRDQYTQIGINID